MVSMKLGKVVECARWFQIVDEASGVYLSLSMMKMLGVAGEDFPRACAMEVCGVEVPQAVCTCLKWEKAPPRPDALPFQPCAENIEAMQEWLLTVLTHYAASAFNKCTHKPLPEMEGP